MGAGAHVLFPRVIDGSPVLFPATHRYAEDYGLWCRLSRFGRVECPAEIVYRYRQHVINLYIWPAAGERDSAPKHWSRQGYNLVHWRHAEMTFWAVSDLAGQELGEFARLLSEGSAHNVGS